VPLLIRPTAIFSEIVPEWFLASDRRIIQLASKDFFI
jgi:hypothetical protein